MLKSNPTYFRYCLAWRFLRPEIAGFYKPNLPLSLDCMLPVARSIRDRNRAPGEASASYPTGYGSVAGMSASNRWELEIAGSPGAKLISKGV